MKEILENRSVLHIVGPDAAKFLQAMVTNDVVGNIYSYNYLLTNQGKYLFDFFVYKQNQDAYFLDVHIDDIAALLKRLRMYKLRSNLEVKDLSSQYKIIYSQSLISSEVEYSIQDPRCKFLGYRSMVASGIFFDKEAGLYISDKYKYTIIDGRPDLIYDRSIPIEYGAEQLHAINYQKGCYVGQEVISRAKYQGVVRKKIFKLISDINIGSTKQGDIITDLDGNKIGVLCSAKGNQAIALLREEKFLELKEPRALIGGLLVNVEIPVWR